MNKIIIFTLLVMSIMMSFSLASADTEDIEQSGMATVASHYPTSNYDDHVIVSRYDPYFRNGLIKFDDISSVPAGSEITSATLYLYNTLGDTESMPIEAYKTTSSWNPATVTWNTRPSYTTTNYSFFVVDSGWVSVSITNIFKEWHNGGDNYGITLSKENWPHVDEKAWFYDPPPYYEPYLRVVFTPPNTPPAAPTLVSPGDGSSSTTSPFIINATATDADDDVLTYYYYGDTTDGTTYLGTSSDEYSWEVTTFDKFYWKARAHDGTEFGDYSDTFNFTYNPGIPTLSTPVNDSVIEYGYPPSDYDMNFTWSDTTAPQYNIKISLVYDFGALVYDSNVAANYSIKNLGNNTYYWKVASYDGVTTGTYSSIFNVTMSLNQTGYKETGGVDGVVYKVSGTDHIELSGAIVSVWNETYSDTITSNVDGYYFFDGLTNGSYNIQATKGGYQNSFIGLVDVPDHNWTPYDIFMSEISGYGEYYEEHDVTFTVTNILLHRYPGVVAKVYIEDGYDIIFEKVTDDMGQVTFTLDKETMYRITFVDATQGIDEEYYAYPRSDSYWILITSTDPVWDKHDISVQDAFDITVSKDDYSVLLAYINVSYVDNTAGTTGVSFYLNQTNHLDPANQTTILFIDSGATNNVNESFVLGEHNGESYILHVLIEHSEYGTVHKYYKVSFDKTSIYDGIPSWFWYALGMFLMFVCGALTLKTRSEEGFVLVCVLGWILFYAGWFAYYHPNRLAVGLTIATIWAVAEFLNKSKEDR